MAKRYLTDQQKNRIAKKQNTVLQEELHLEQPQQGLVITHYGKTLEVESTQGIIIRCNPRQSLGAIAVGDDVIYGLNPDGTGIITAVKPRRSELYRYNKFEGDKLVAANVDQLFIVTTFEPKRALNVIDRYLVLAHLQKITPIIVFNKVDLLDPDSLEEFTDYFNYYADLGYQIVFTSATGNTLKNLTALLPRKNSIFVGVSGVGKSSLVKAILPEHDIAIGALSEKSKEGAHTTTNARLFHLANNGTNDAGNLIDCPGIRELTLGNITPQQALSGFYELAELATQCQFRDCSHDHEPGCAILSALEADELNVDRLASYRSIIEQLTNPYAKIL